MKRLSLAVFVFLFSLFQPVFAGPLEDAKAQAHLAAVAAGNLDALIADYPDDAYMDWIGGPLDGRYRGKAAIREVWQKFIAANDGKPRPAKFGKLESYANPKGVTIEASAEYGGTKPVKAWHILVYREGSLATEIWQVAPTLQVAP